MKVRFIDLQREHIGLRKEINAFWKKFLTEGNYILGEAVKNFENDFARYCGTKYCVGVNSGTDALIIALKALGIKKGDEVITTPFTFTATAEAVLETGAMPVFVDIDRKTLTLSPERFEEFLCERARNGMDTKTGRRIRGVIPVHLYGLPCEMGKFVKVARKYELHVVEDCAQAHGAEVRVEGKSRKIGSIGDAGCFSFYPTKNMGGMGDGGCILTNKKSIAEMCRMLRNHGRDERGNHRLPARNSRLDEIQAGILKIKLQYLDKWVERRRKIAEMYITALSGVGDIRFPIPPEGSKPVYNIFTILTKKRDALRKYLARHGIETSIYYPLPLHRLPHFQNRLFRGGSLTVSEQVAKEVLSLPIYPSLKNSEVEYICNKIKEFFKK